MSMLRSRFTLSPTERVPKLLRSRVSCMAVTVYDREAHAIVSDALVDFQFVSERTFERKVQIPVIPFQGNDGSGFFDNS